MFVILHWILLTHCHIFSWFLTWTWLFRLFLSKCFPRLLRWVGEVYVCFCLSSEFHLVHFDSYNTIEEDVLSFDKAWKLGPSESKKKKKEEKCWYCILFCWCCKLGHWCVDLHREYKGKLSWGTLSSACIVWTEVMTEARQKEGQYYKWGQEGQSTEGCKQTQTICQWRHWE